MQFFGIQKNTLIDYPGEVATTLFTFGCNFYCPYCHNPELINNKNKIMPIEWNDIFNFLDKRKKVLGGVCITGGEPLLYKEIPGIIDQIHSLGLKVKIDTNGSFPERLTKCNVDYIAMDIKSSLEKYKYVCSIEKTKLSEILKQSIKYIINSGISYEFRTTVVPDIVEIDDIKKITDLIKGAQKYILAQFRPKNTLDPELENIPPYPFSVLEKMKKIVESKGIECEIRGKHR
jgi:pyruvate formate lyase activating enzyme